MQHLDEGTIHSWLDGALTAEDAARVELHVTVCEACSEAVAEARGLIAASSRILTALDDVPRVGARRDRGSRGGRGAFLVRSRIAAVIALVVAGGALAVAVRRGASPTSQVQLATERVSDLELAAADSPAEQAAPAPQEVPVAQPPRDGQAVGRVGSGAAAPSSARERDLAGTPPANPARTAVAAEGYAVAAAPPAAPAVQTDDTVRTPPIVMAERAERQHQAEARSAVSEKLAGALGPRRSAADAAARFAEPVVPETRLNAASVEVVAPLPLTEERTAENGRVVVRRIYRIEGMLVTLDERQPLAREEVAQERLRRLDERVAAVAPRPDSTPRPVNSVRWVDARGAEFTLSGSATQPQLERIRKLLGY